MIDPDTKEIFHAFEEPLCKSNYESDCNYLANHKLFLFNSKDKHMNGKMKSLVFATIFFVFFTGCMNMPTKPSQITGSYTSGFKYENYDCSRLASELNSLARRENQLVVAQEQRIKTSQVQAFWLGYGQGDGIEASELANVRGEKESVRNVMEARNCQVK